MRIRSPRAIKRWHGGPVAFPRFLFEQKLYSLLSCYGHHSGTLPATGQLICLLVPDFAKGQEVNYWR